MRPPAIPGFDPGVESLTMTPAEWALVPGNPRQRNTEERVRRAKHLLNFVEDHRVVKMAVMPDDTCIKIDGHTRDLLWRQHPEMAPQTVLVIVFRVADLAAARRLYDASDNALAMETSTDKVYGSFRELAAKPQSPFMQTGRIAAALRIAYGYETHQAPVGVHQLVEHWLPELHWLDGLALTPSYFPTPVLTAAVMTLRRYGAAKQDDQNDAGHLAPSARRGGWAFEKDKAVRDFWERYNRNDGSKSGQEIDPIEALRRLVEQHRQHHLRKATVYFTASRAIACVERHLLKRGYKVAESGGSMIKGLDLSRYFPPPAVVRPEKPPDE